MNGIKSRIVLASIALIVFTVAAIQISNWWFISQHNQQQVHSQVQRAAVFLQQYLQSREQNLLNTAKVIAKDFGFRQAVASGDKLTIESMLENHSARIAVELMLIIQPDGSLIAANDAKFYDQTSTIGEWVKNETRQSESQFVLINNQLYRCFLIPIQAPLNIGYTVVGYQITSALLAYLQQKTGLELHFVSEHSPLLVSSDPAMWQAAQQKSPALFDWLKRQPYQVEPLPIQSQDQISLYVQADLSKIYQQYDRFNYTLLFIGACSILLAVLLSTILLNRLANPLSGVYQELYHRANYDHLTGILNRHAATKRIQQALNRAVRTDQIFCIALCDIDHFKQVNDTYGHVVGDAVLKKFTQRIQTALREYDVFGRFGGEEFLISIELPKQEASVTFDRLREIISAEPLTVQADTAISLTMSIGVCIIKPDETLPSIDTIIASADAALYKAKQNGRNQVIFTQVQHYSTAKKNNILKVVVNDK